MQRNVPISVVLTIYNGERFLAEAVDSILAQTFSDFELIAVDDGSTDRSLAILQAYAAQDQRVRLISRPNTGQAGAINDGVYAARGEFVARMDADDVLRPDRFRRQYEFLKAHPDIGVLGAAYQAIDETGTCIGQPNRYPLEPTRIRKALQNGSCAIAHPAVMLRRTALLRAGPYRGVLRPAEDYDLWLRMSEFTNLANLPEVLLLYRIHGGSLSVRHAFQQALGTELARRAWFLRQAGRDDPIRDEQTITPSLLERVGISANEVELLRGQTLRYMSSNHLSRGNHLSAMAVIAEYECAEISPWVRKRLAPEFALLRARIQRMQGHPMAVVVGAALIRDEHGSSK
jgi:glycosyltransferase involved in cell wall biosynthesis